MTAPRKLEVATNRTAAGVIFDMEDEVRSSLEFIQAGMIIAERGQVGCGLSKEECRALGRVLWAARDEAADVVRKWEIAFRASRPRATGAPTCDQRL